MNGVQVVQSQVPHTPAFDNAPDLSPVPGELRKFPTWILWSLEERDGKPTKVPYSPHGGRADVTKPETWASLAETLKRFDPLLHSGVGCVITSPYVGIDLDKCRDAETGEVQPWALEVIAALNSYTELSPSGRGFHVWVKATKGTAPAEGRRRGQIEVYPHSRYFTVTGEHFEGTPATITEGDLTAFVAKYIDGDTANRESKKDPIPPSDDSLSAKEWKQVCDIIRRLGRDATEESVRLEFFATAGYREKWAKNRTYIERTIRKAIEHVHGTATVNGKPVETKLERKYFSEVEAKPILWLWKERIPKGKLTIFSGDPDCGKTTVLCDLIARYTTGRDYPDGAANTIGAGEVLMLNCEDDPADTIKPRLLAAGADVSRVSQLEGVITEVGDKREERMLALDTDLALLERELKNNPQIGLVTVDPITSYLGKSDMLKEQELRRLLVPVKDLCERLGVTVIANGHFNKRSDVSALHKIGGAVAMSGVARAAWLFAKNPEAEGEYLMLLGKNNLTKKRTGMKYRFGTKDLSTGEAPFIVWGGDADSDADSVFTTANDSSEKRRAKAERFLSEYLADGMKKSDEVLAEGKKHRLSRSALFEAKKELGIAARKIGNEWYWELSGELF